MNLLLTIQTSKKNGNASCIWDRIFFKESKHIFRSKNEKPVSAKIITITPFLTLNITHSLPVDKTNVLNTQFASTFTIWFSSTIPASQSDLISVLMPELSVTEKMVLISLDKLDVNKSKGPDGICPSLLKECQNILSSPLWNTLPFFFNFQVYYCQPACVPWGNPPTRLTLVVHCVVTCMRGVA